VRQPPLFLEVVVAPRGERRNRVFGKECRSAAAVGDFPRYRFGGFLAELERARLRRLGPCAAHAELTFQVNIHAMFYLTKAAVPHMKNGGAIINTASINADKPNPTLLAYATIKGAVQNFTAGLAQLLAEKGIRANTVAPGPIWTPLIRSTMPEEAVVEFGKERANETPGPTGRARDRLCHAR